MFADLEQAVVERVSAVAGGLEPNVRSVIVECFREFAQIMANQRADVVHREATVRLSDVDFQRLGKANGIVRPVELTRNMGGGYGRAQFLGGPAWRPDGNEIKVHDPNRHFDGYTRKSRGLAIWDKDYKGGSWVLTALRNPGSGGGWRGTDFGWLIGKLNADLGYQSSASCSVWTQDTGGAFSDTGEDVTVYDWMLASGYELASGSKVVAFQHPASGLWIPIASENCPQTA